MAITKGAALTLRVPLFGLDNLPIGETPTMTLSLDGAAEVAATIAPTAEAGVGCIITLTAAETEYSTIRARLVKGTIQQSTVVINTTEVPAAVAALASTALSDAVWTPEKAAFVDASIASRSTFVDGGNVNATNMVAAPDNIGIATLVGRPAPTNAVTPVTDLTVTNAKIDAAKNSADEANRIAPATPANVTTAQVVITDAIDAKPVTPATDISEVSSVVELLAKYMKNELQRLDNGDGTITVTLLDDDDLTPLLTWTYQVATTTREKAV